MNPPLYLHQAPDKSDLAAGRRHEKKVLASLPLENNREAIVALQTAPSRRILSQGNTESRLSGILGRASQICNAVNLERVKKFIDEARESLNSDDARKELTDMVAASMGDGVDARTAKAALGKMIAVNTGHLIRGNGNWIQAFQSVSLGEDEIAWLRNYVPQQIDIRVGTGDGTLNTVKALPNQESNAKVETFFLLSDIFTATLFDKDKGRISDAALGVVDISLDLADKIDALLQVPFTVGGANTVFVTNFVNNGTPASHFHASSRINTANYPDGNIIVLGSNTNSTIPRFDIIRAIDDYFARFGSNFDSEGELVGMEIRVASKWASSFGNEFTPTSVANPYTDKLFGNRMMLPFNGRNYTVIPDATIDPADKYVYVTSNRPAGLFFDKPAGAHVHRAEDVLLNEVTTFERALIGTAFPITWAPRALAVKWRS